MTRSKDYYQTKVRDGTWAQPDDQEQQIIALQAKLSEFSGSPKFYQGKQGDDKKGKGKGEGKGKNGKKGNEESNWRTKAPPAADKLKAKYIRGDKKPFYWCEHHKKEVRSTQASRLQQQNGNGCRARLTPESSSGPPRTRRL